MTTPAAARFQFAGILCAAGGAMLFAGKGILAKFAWRHGVGFEALVIVRALLAAPLFWAFAFAREAPAAICATPARVAATAAFAGLLCYYGGALVDFYALTLIDASLERVLLFSYPAMVIAIDAAWRRRLPSARVVGVVTLTWAGIFLAVGGLDAAALRANLTGALCVLLAALSYAIYFLLGERCIRVIGSTRFTLCAMTGAAAALAVHGLAKGAALGLAGIDAVGWMLLALLAVLCMFVPALLQAEGVRRIGAQRSALVSTVGPPTTIVLAWLFFGERMAPSQLVGVVLIVGGIFVLDAAVTRRRER
ncbi:MAG: DMT family transporter [Steroidobacteraceae bacterium]